MSASNQKETGRARSRTVEGPFAATCPTRELLDQLSDKWAVLVLIALSEEPTRFNALKRRIEGVSQKVLTATLRTLERNGLVERKVIATVPVTVEYSISPLGRSLYDPLEALRQWSMLHMRDVAQARARFDRRLSREPR